MNRLSATLGFVLAVGCAAVACAQGTETAPVAQSGPAGMRAASYEAASTAGMLSPAERARLFHPERRLSFNAFASSADKATHGKRPAGKAKSHKRRA